MVRRDTMGKFTEDAEEILEGKGVEPSRPLVLQLLGQIVNDVYDNFYEAKEGKTSSESQKIALDRTFDHLSVTKIKEWRDDYQRDGYVKMFSPMLDDMFYICKDDETFKFITGGGDAVNKTDDKLVCYTEHELKRLKLLNKEDVKWIHLGKTFQGQLQ
jgi:hypothetical protein